MRRIKQIDECLDRFFQNKKPLKKKWQARWHPEHDKVLVLYHYHHLILVFDTLNKKILYKWWELPADKRGFDAAKDYLNKHFEITD